MINAFKEQIELRLSELVSNSSPFFASLYDGARYTVLSGGKRIRPLLTLATAYSLDSCSLSASLSPACALELVHTYSLIHDDLPSMDNDDFRRGKKTLHKLYSDAHAILTGDFLLTFAFEVLSKAKGIGAEQKLRLIQSLSHSAGAEGMIGGQIMDIENVSVTKKDSLGKGKKKQPQEKFSVEEMHRRKTALLFGSATEFGAIISNQNEAMIQKVNLLGVQFGLLFQMVDDIIDDDHPLGKKQAEKTIRNLQKNVENSIEELFADSSLIFELLTKIISQIPSKKVLV